MFRDYFPFSFIIFKFIYVCIRACTFFVQVLVTFMVCGMQCCCKIIAKLYTYEGAEVNFNLNKF